MENNKKLGQEPAFPLPPEHNDNSMIPNDYDSGMSKRFYAACAAMQGLLSNTYISVRYDIIAEESFEYADELLKQEND